MADQMDTIKNEEWRAVSGYEGIYEVSDLGRVRRLIEFRPLPNNPRVYEPRRWRVIAAYASAGGYLQARLSKGGAAKTVLVYRLVCEAFYGHAPKGQGHVAHWDGNRANNVAPNLRWASPKENAHDRNRHGTAPFGEQSPNRRLSENDVREIRGLYQGRRGDLSKLSTMFGVTSTQILHIVRRKQWTHV